MKKKQKIINPLWTIMKASTLQIVLMLIATAYGHAYTSEAQQLLSQKVSVKVEQKAIREVLAILEKNVDVKFVYSVQLLPADRKITLHMEDKQLSEVLEKMFQPDHISYKQIRNKIVLKKVDRTLSDFPEMAPISPVMAMTRVADRVLTGVVKDNTGEPLPGVSITVKGTTSGTSTDVEGKFSLSIPDNNVTLVFSFVGYIAQEIQPGAQTSLQIELKPDTKALEEVVVIGYGTVKRQDFTGSVSSLKMEGSSIALMPNMNALEALKGSLPGLNIGASNTAGGQPSVDVRGQNSINGSNDPLIVLDGVVFLGNLADINPNDIASFDVLKDATSAAAYGSRSANGVIAITTKRGKVGKPVITLNSSTGFQTWQNRPEMMRGEEWIKVVNARNKYAEGSTNWMKPGELANLAAGRETNWLDQVTQTGVIQTYQAAVSGASERVSYYMSTAYDKNKGIVIGDGFDRISLSGKVKTNITDWLEVGVDAGYSKRTYTGTDPLLQRSSNRNSAQPETRFAANINEAQTMSPYGVMYRDEAGNLEKYPYTQSAINPLWGVNDGTRSNQDVRLNYRLNSNAVVSVPWVEGLTYRVNLLYNTTSNESGNFTNERYYVQEGEGPNRYLPSTVQGFLTNANGVINTYGTKSYVFDNIINYKNAFGKHGIDVTLVATRDHQQYQLVASSGNNFAANGNTTLGMWGLHKATVQRVNQDANERSNIGYLARASYAFDDKYFLTGSYRRDGASVFGANNKWANFLAAGVAWKISSEEFLKSFAPLNNLKVKFSYGQNGNQGVAPFATLSTIANAASGGSRYEFSNTPGIINYGLYQDALGNAGLGWETTTSWNAGFESAWLNNRLFLDLDVYYGKTTDQIFVRNIPVMTGFKTIRTSMGQVNNRGVEITVRSVNLKSRDLSWNTSLTFWQNRNKLAKLYGEDNDGDGREDDDIANNLFIGQPLGTIFGYEQIGIVQVGDAEYIAQTGAAPGAPKYKDIDGQAGITPADRKVLGYAQENFRLNMSNTLTYKNFELYVMLTGTFGGGNRFLRSNQQAYMTAGTGRFNDNMTSKPYWTPENPSNVYPSAYFTGDGRFLGLQSRAFVRVQDVTLSYRLKPEWISKIRMNSAKLFVSARNLATFTKWEGGDPETGTTVRDNTFPVPTSYSIGANISF
ncbi:TonB-linked SusC/RagA family outer membrane protein [Dyadobacter jiangsuensis]|uniref:TonB-linked SusC/RagA family outer membrane protein n=2 Tax=Dyadobacter jiangsuensis TaxID=1591085 RepID=A0A2P8GB26_9BACT|nr:TonB-linked SusC/RagA family outer membrane protein [Dyadobacter jiangsuensis]